MARQVWLITGASGQLGGHVIRQLATQGEEPRLLALAGRHDVGTPGAAVERVDLSDMDALRRCVIEHRPTHIVHLAAMTALAECHARPAEAEQINTQAPRVLAEAADHVAARLVFASTDMVFAGDAAPYRESDPPRPVNQYGRTKAEAERLVVGVPRTLVVRLPLMYGFPCTARQTTFVRQITALRNDEPLRLFADEFRTPMWLAAAARAVIGLARSTLTGMVHVAGPERLSRYELIAACARVLGITAPRLVPISRLDATAPEPRPADLSLNADHFGGLFPELVPGPVHPAALGR